MTMKVPLIRIGVSREGQTVYPEIGTPFDFTKDEIADINAMAKGAGVDYLRNPVNEAAGESMPSPADSVKKGADKSL